MTQRFKERYSKMGEDEKKQGVRRINTLMAYNMAVDDMDGKIDR